MLYGIISDIHGSEVSLEQALSILKKESVDKIVCLGDIIGKSGDSIKCLDMLFEEDALLISGNHDRLSINDLPKNYQKELKKRMQMKRKEENLLFSHTATCRNAFYGIEPWKDNKVDSLEKAYDQFMQEAFFIFFYGHKHEARVFELSETGQIKDSLIKKPTEILLHESKRYMCNTGPITRKKDIDIENPHRKGIIIAVPSFVIYDSEKQKLNYLFLNEQNQAC